MINKKLNSIEEVLAHQEQHIHDLNEIVTRQWNEIDMLKKNMVKMQSKISIFESNTHAAEDKSLSDIELAAQEKPPHY